MFRETYKSAFDKVTPNSELLEMLILEAKKEEAKTDSSKVVFLKRVYRTAGFITAIAATFVAVVVLNTNQISDDNLSFIPEIQNEESTPEVASVVLEDEIVMPKARKSVAPAPLQNNKSDTAEGDSAVEMENLSKARAMGTNDAMVTQYGAIEEYSFDWGNSLNIPEDMKKVEGNDLYYEGENGRYISIKNTENEEAVLESQYIFTKNGIRFVLETYGLTEEEKENLITSINTIE